MNVTISQLKIESSSAFEYIGLALKEQSCHLVALCCGAKKESGRSYTLNMLVDY